MPWEENEQGVHDAFPPDKDDGNDSLSLKKLVNKEGEWALLKDMLGFDFDGDLKTMQLEEKKRVVFLLGLGERVYCFHATRFWQKGLLEGVFAWEQTPGNSTPRHRCKELIIGSSDCLGIKDASIHGVWGFVVGEGKAHGGTITINNWDLEMTGLLMLWLEMEEGQQAGKQELASSRPIGPGTGATIKSQAGLPPAPVHNAHC
eukprot:scaffold92087_cov69-Cyclotella_meneghiniana.AAC.6